MITDLLFRRNAARMVVMLGAVLMTLPGTAYASGLLIADGGNGGVLEIQSHEVSVIINNGIAVTEVRQVFRNTEQRVVEALYTFPVPAGASVSNFSMIINGREMVGEVVEKKRARQIYDSYKAVKRDPGLLEQVDYRTFELRIFPIAAGAEQHIRVTYCQQLDFDHDNATWVYPLATTTRPGVDQKVHGKFALTVDVKSEIPITKVFSPSHEDDFVIFSHDPKYTRASMETEGADLGRDVVISFDTERPRTGIDVITSRQRSDEDGFFMLTMTAGKELEEYGAGMDYLFLVDISGSMANDNKLVQSRATVASFTDALGSDDRFEILTFSNVPEPHFGALTAADDASRTAAREFLNSKKARGGTVLRPALQTAWKYRDQDRPLNVVLLSDGMTEPKEQSELLQLISEAPTGIRVFCIGIGNEVNRPLLKQMAEGAGGLAAFVSQEDDFARQAQMFRRKLMRPVATDVRMEVTGVELAGLTSEEMPDLFYGAPLRLFGRYRAAGNAEITIHANVMGQPVTQTVTLAFPETNTDNPEIERMWALEQVQQRMGKLRETGESPQLVQEIVALCEGFSIVSEYASFIVLENDSEYQRWSIERRNLNRVQRDEAAQQRLQRDLEVMREKSLANIGPANSATPTSTQQPVPAETPTAPASPAPPVQPATPGDLNWAQPQSSNPQPAPAPSSGRSPTPFFGGGGGGGGGGGAVDPLTALMALGLAGAAATRRQRRNSASGR
jgi:Ca-activated chloride channel family protein